MKISVKKLGIIAVFLSLFFLTSYNGTGKDSAIGFLLKHFDEIYVIAFSAICLIYIQPLMKIKKEFILAWGCFIGIGLLSSAVFRYQPVHVVMMDVLVVSKFMIGYLFVVTIAQNEKCNISESIFTSARVVAVVLFLLAIHDLFFTPLFPKADYRYFTYSLRLMFPHPTYLAAACISLLIYFGYMDRKYMVLPYMIMLSLVAALTLRAKTLGFLFVFWFLYIVVIKLHFRKYILLAITGVLAVALIGYSQIADYFFSNIYSPRKILLTNSLKIAADHAPIGAGFGTFGTPIAAQYYSPLYTLLGFPNFEGMTSDYPIYLSDSFWPIIFGQFGFLGCVIFIYVIWRFVKKGIETFQRDQYAGFAMLITIVNMLIASLAESSFFNMGSLVMFMLFAVYETETARGGQGASE